MTNYQVSALEPPTVLPSKHINSYKLFKNKNVFAYWSAPSSQMTQNFFWFLKMGFEVHVQ